MTCLCTTSSTALARIKKNKVLGGKVLAARLSREEAKERKAESTK
jgi:hypothetical protein